MNGVGFLEEKPISDLCDLPELILEPPAPGRVSHSGQVRLCSPHQSLPNSHSPNGNAGALQGENLQRCQCSQGSSLAHSLTLTAQIQVLVCF